ncbi:helix-turn-helix transcriptional regulator [Phascolarctobacterium succinatutens]|uniref:helix-turn-helix transcriptional regulator n=1 Tax=Phascolarctobacterium succinatutens TaxID=626940 RepID=UPI00307AE33F
MKLTLKAARVNKGLTQKDAAKLMGVSRNVISNWERQISFPDVLQVKRIEEVYGLQFQEIIFLPSEYALSV